MPALPEEAVEALKKTVAHVDFRAKRLSEWRELRMELRNAESRFDVFVAKLKSIAGGVPDAIQTAELQNAWDDCDRQLIELELLPDRFQVITLVLEDQSADPAATTKTWITDLIAAGKKVGTDLRDRGYGQLATHTAEYRGAFTKINIKMDARVALEVGQLAELTNALKLRLA